MKHIRAAVAEAGEKVRCALAQYERSRAPHHFEALKRAVDEWEYELSQWQEAVEDESPGGHPFRLM